MKTNISLGILRERVASFALANILLDVENKVRFEGNAAVRTNGDDSFFLQRSEKKGTKTKA